MCYSVAMSINLSILMVLSAAPNGNKMSKWNDKMDDNSSKLVQWQVYAALGVILRLSSGCALVTYSRSTYFGCNYNGLVMNWQKLSCWASCLDYISSPFFINVLTRLHHIPCRIVGLTSILRMTAPMLYRTGVLSSEMSGGPPLIFVTVWNCPAGDRTTDIESVTRVAEELTPWPGWYHSSPPYTHMATLW